MAKHPHKLLFINKQTWRCVLENCSFFVHQGLAHVLVGKRAICWNCEEVFVIDSIALREDKPRCDDCRGIQIPDTPSVSPVNTVSTIERTPEQQARYDKEMAQMFGKDWRKLLEGKE